MKKKIKCSKCGKEIPQEGSKKQNYFVEADEKICIDCYFKNWDKAEKPKRRRR